MPGIGLVVANTYTHSRIKEGKQLTLRSRVLNILQKNLFIMFINI